MDHLTLWLLKRLGQIQELGRDKHYAFQLKPIHCLIHGLNCTRYILQSRTNQFVGINSQNLPSIRARPKKLNSMKSQFHLKATPVAYGSQRVNQSTRRYPRLHRSSLRAHSTNMHTTQSAAAQFGTFTFTRLTFDLSSKNYHLE